MKKHLFTSLVIAFLSGVASAEVVVEIDGNTFYSSSPGIRIKVNPDFIYYGNLTYEEEGNPTEVYAFVNPTNDKYIKNALLIYMYRTDRAYPSNPFASIDNKIDYGTDKIDGHDFNFYAKAIALSNRSSFALFLANNGFLSPECVLIKNFEKLIGSTEPIILHIDFLENITAIKFDCDNWKQKNDFTGKQSEVFKQFNQNCLSSFRFLLNNK